MARNAPWSYAAAFKTEVDLAAATLEEDKTPAEPAPQIRHHPNRIQQWKLRLVVGCFVLCPEGKSRTQLRLGDLSVSMDLGKRCGGVRLPSTIASRLARKVKSEK